MGLEGGHLASEWMAEVDRSSVPGGRPRMYGFYISISPRKDDMGF